jgi:hypothetical protein
MDMLLQAHNFEVLKIAGGGGNSAAEGVDFRLFKNPSFRAWNDSFG